jgi:hypothetical protein
LPRVEDYQPERLADELPDLVYYAVDTTQKPPRLTIQSDGTRMSDAYGNTGKGAYLDEYLGPRLKPVVMPVHYECVRRALPAYTISMIDDIYGRAVAYERLLLPFSNGRRQRYHRFAEDHQPRRRFCDQEPDAGQRYAAGTKPSQHHRSRAFSSLARPHRARRRDRIQLSRRIQKDQAGPD